MGDIADWMLDQALEQGLYEYGGLKTCRCCGQSDLHWGQLDNGKWVLVTASGQLHHCPVNPLKV